MTRTFDSLNDRPKSSILGSEEGTFSPLFVGTDAEGGCGREGGNSSEDAGKDKGWVKKTRCFFGLLLVLKSGNILNLAKKHHSNFNGRAMTESK